MSDTVVGCRTGALLADVHTVIDDLLGAFVGADTDSEILDSLRESERVIRRMTAMQHALVLQIEQRGAGYTYGATTTTTTTTTAAVLATALRVDGTEAAARVRAAEAAAEAAGPRRDADGQATPPIYPAVAAGQAAGVVSARQAQVIVACVERLPGEVQAVHGARIEAELVAYAADFAPCQLGKLAIRYLAYLDPDGKFQDGAYRAKIRDLTLYPRPDGSSRVTGELTAELTARLHVHLDALAAPKPAADGVKDPRTAGQRRHDALLATLDLQQRAELLPDTGGVAATIILTMDADTYNAAYNGRASAGGTGLATTGHGALVPANEALGWVGADVRVIAVLLDSMRGIAGYSHTQRIFTQQQRLAITARDGGCTFPGCTAPPAWTQIHHIVEHQQGGPTSVDNAAMICGHHHRTFELNGWRVIMSDNRPAWIPPPWIDQHQRPRRNHHHRPDLS